MSKILFNKIQNISASTITVNGDSLTAGSYLYICKNPKYFTTYMSDITSLYTRGLVSIYDNSNSVISSTNVWDSIDYNVQLSNSQSPEVSINSAVLISSVALSGYEGSVICNPSNIITLTLPTISTLTIYKPLTIKNISNYAITINRSDSDTIDGNSTSVILNTLESISIQPNNTLSSWIKLVSTGTQGAQGATGAGTQGAQGYQGSTGVGTQGPQGYQGYQGSTPSTSNLVANVSDSYQVTSIQVVTALPAVGDRVTGRLYFVLSA